MGSSNVDYKNQIDSSLAQSNLPKAPLAQEYSNLFGNASPGLMNALMNVQNLGNSFVNSNNPSFKPYSPGQANPTGIFGLGPAGQGQNTVNNAYDWLFNTVGNHKADVSPSNPNQGFSGINGVGGRPNIPAPTLPDGFSMGSGTDYGSSYYNGIKVQGKTTDQNGMSAWQLADGNTIPWSADQENTINQNAIQNYYRQFPSSPSNPGNGQVNRPTSNTGSNPNDPYGLFAGFSNFFGPNAGIDPNTGAPAGFNKSSFGPNSQIPFDWSSATPILGGQLPRDPNNPTQPYQPGTYPTTPISSPGSSTNLANGLPNGITIPDLITAFQGDTGGAINGLGNAANSTASMLQHILSMNPSALQSIGQNGGANLGLSNPNQQIQQLLSMVGGGPQNVSTQNVNNPNFTQQILNPGQASANFNPAQANLSGVPNSTQLSPQNSSAFDAISQILNQQNAKNIGDIRERDLQTGTARSTGAGYDEASYRAQALPQLASSLENVRNQEVDNQLNQAQLQQQGLLSNTGMANEYGLGSAQLSSNVQLQNIQNMLNAGNLNNLTSLQARGQDVGTALANASNAINVGQGNQGAGLTAQGQNYGLLNELLGNQTNQGGLNLQNFLGTIGANQNQQGIANQYSNSNVNANNSLASLLTQLSQFNAGQGNQYNLQTGSMNQQAAQNQIQNQLSQLAALFGMGTGMASQGIPGGSANVNIGNTAPQGGGLGGTLGGIGSLISALSNYRG